ncbi:hypothetical protein DER45DRAFT_268571 [Fusarium avenaceum]|nr:hypothetical protein DER45DRAFT_268571 [Fusarium avenaceum]
MHLTAYPPSFFISYSHVSHSYCLVLLPSLVFVCLSHLFSYFLLACCLLDLNSQCNLLNVLPATIIYPYHVFLEL